MRNSRTFVEDGGDNAVVQMKEACRYALNEWLCQEDLLWVGRIEGRRDYTRLWCGLNRVWT